MSSDTCLPLLTPRQPWPHLRDLDQGAASVTRDGRQVAELAAGDFFGELALLDPAPRDATVTTTEPAELLLIDSRRFQPLLDDVPVLARKITAGLARRLRAADTGLVSN